MPISKLVSHRRTAGGALAALLLLVSTVLGADAKRQPAPEWELKDVAGKTVKLSDFKGKVVVLDFWATWCPPCREEIPGFIALQKKYADKGLVIIGVSLDEGGAAVVAPFVSKMAMNYPVVLGTQDMAAKYGDIQAIPTTFVIDRQGNVAAGYEGLTDEKTFESVIQKLL